jgi:hypothetical protein
MPFSEGTRRLATPDSADIRGRKKLTWSSAIAVKWWISCYGFTVQVSTDSNGRILFAAPIVSQFVGQSLGRLFDDDIRTGKLVMPWSVSAAKARETALL